jgi:hypothetical protein
MNKATMGFAVICAGLIVGFSPTAASAECFLQTGTGDTVLLAQNTGRAPVDPAEVRRDNTADPGSAPRASTTGGRPVPVDPAEVRRDNTRDPNSAPLTSPTGGRPAPVDPAEVRRDNTRDPG